MPILLQGWNPFYEGWIAGLFDQDPRPPEDGTPADYDGWIEGWKTAIETKDNPTVRHLMWEGITREVTIGHITVTPVK